LDADDLRSGFLTQQQRLQQRLRGGLAQGKHQLGSAPIRGSFQ
jgi:hypothetical protein